MQVHHRLIVALVGVLGNRDGMLPDGVAGTVDPGDQNESGDPLSLQRTRFELIVERKLRRRQLTEDGNVEITGRDLREKNPPDGRGNLFERASALSV
jgi:hypothetical protein